MDETHSLEQKSFSPAIPLLYLPSSPPVFPRTKSTNRDMASFTRTRHTQLLFLRIHQSGLLPMASPGRRAVVKEALTLYKGIRLTRRLAQ